MCFMSHAEASDSTSLRGALGLGTCRPRGTPSVKAQQPEAGRRLVLGPGFSVAGEQRGLSGGPAWPCRS